MRRQGQPYPLENPAVGDLVRTVGEIRIVGPSLLPGGTLGEVVSVSPLVVDFYGCWMKADEPVKFDSVDRLTPVGRRRGAPPKEKKGFASGDQAVLSTDVLDWDDRTLIPTGTVVRITQVMEYNYYGFEYRASGGALARSRAAGSELAPTSPSEGYVGSEI
jgi:hypothetical protein